MLVIDLHHCSVGAFHLRQELLLPDELTAPDGRKIRDDEVLVFEPYPEVVIDLWVSWREGRPVGRIVWIIVDAPSGATVFGRPMTELRTADVIRQARQEGIPASGGVEDSLDADDVALSDDVMLGSYIDGRLERVFMSADECPFNAARRRSVSDPVWAAAITTLAAASTGRAGDQRSGAGSC